MTPFTLAGYRPTRPIPDPPDDGLTSMERRVQRATEDYWRRREANRQARERRARLYARLFSRASAELGRAMARWPCPSSVFLCPFYAAVAGALWLGLSARDGLPWLPREE